MGHAAGRRRVATEMLGANPEAAQSIQQPLQTIGGQNHRLARVNADLGGRAGAEQVATLPLGGDLAAGHLFEPGNQDRLVLIFGVPELGFTFMGILPMPRHQTYHGFTAVIGLHQCLLPSLPRPNPGTRIAIQEDLAVQPSILLNQPLPHRDRLPIVPTGITQEHPRHRSSPRRRTLTSVAWHALIHG